MLAIRGSTMINRILLGFLLVTLLLFLKLLCHLSPGPVSAFNHLGRWLFLTMLQANAFTAGIDNMSC